MPREHSGDLDRPVLIFDGDCAFCRRCVALLERWDRARRVRAVPLQDAAALDGLPAIPRSALETAMHFVAEDGTVFAGAAALAPLLRRLQGGSYVAPLLETRLAARAAGAVYRLVARNRHRLPCGSATCRRGD